MPLHIVLSISPQLAKINSTIFKTITSSVDEYCTKKRTALIDSPFGFVSYYNVLY